MAAVTPLLANYAHYTDEYQLLVCRIHRLFKAGGFQIPDIGLCFRIADYVIVVRGSTDPEAEKHHARLRRHGYAFLRELAVEQPRWSGTATEAWIARVAEEIEGFLRIHIEDIWMFAKYAKEAWERANNGKYPRSTERNAPLCKFIVAVLGEAGIDLSPATVSAVLQGKRRQHGK
jgi:hypothetical protein